MTGRKNNKKVAITKNGNDLLRIITSDKNTDSFEIKITPFTNDCRVNTVRLLSNEVIIWDVPFNKTEFTYHIKNERKNTKIHIKGEGEHYYDLPWKDLVDLSYDFDFPVPLFKLMLPSNLKNKKYKKKKTHVPYDLKDYNIAEIYLMSNNSFIEGTPIKEEVMTQLMFNSFEFYANNLFPNDKTKATFYEKDFKSGTQMGAVSFKINDRLSILVVFYTNDSIEHETYTFIENSYAKEIMLLKHMYRRGLNRLTNEYSYIDVRGCMLADLNQVSILNMKPKLLPNTFVEYLYNKRLMPKETKEKIHSLGIKSAIRLKNLFINKQDKSSKKQCWNAWNVFFIRFMLFNLTFCVIIKVD